MALKGQTLFLFLSILVYVSANDPTVHLQQGDLLGTILKSNKNTKEIYSFQGIPYVAPPLNDLRFKPPQPPLPWTGTRNNLSPIPSCPQHNYFTKTFEGIEDCLLLNVYTPKLEKQGNGLDVMVWIHGGGFFTGSGNTDMYGPELLLDHDIVLVTFNYRLGVLGFLSFETKDYPGNYGLKDQVAALKWVKDNIEKFGGNPNSVTIFGESAGGASVEYLMLSPLARGLFHRAISQSGSAQSNWAIQRHPRDLTLKLANKLNCSTNNDEEIIKCLNELTTHQLEDGATEIFHGEDIAARFVPNIEPSDTLNPFIIEEPLKMLFEGNIANVPLMAGLLTHEGMYSFIEINTNNRTVEEDLKKNTRKYLPELYGLTYNSTEYFAVYDEIKAYFKQLEPNDPIESYIHMNSDAEFVPDVDEFVRNFAKLKKNAVYYYLFSYDGGRSLLKNITQLKRKGTCHADELSYLFTGRAYAPLTTATPEDLKCIDILTSLWTNFAKTGNPTPSDSTLGVVWAPVEVTDTNEINTQYLEIDNDITMKNTDLFGDRIKFWNTMNQKYRKINW